MKISPNLNTTSFNQGRSRIDVDASAFKYRASHSFSSYRSNRTHSSSSDFILAKPELVKKEYFSNPKHASGGAHALADSLASSGNKMASSMLYFGELARSDAASFQQEIRHHEAYKSPKDNEPNPTLNIDNFKFKEQTDSQSLSLAIKTQSGKTINFNLQQYTGFGTATSEDGKPSDSSSVKGVKVDWIIDGELSNEEKQQLTELSKNLESFSQSFFTENKANFKALKLNQFDEIESLEFRAKQSPNSHELMFKYENTDINRRFSAKFEDNTVDMIVSKAQPFLVNQQGRQQALSHYLSLIEDSKEKSRGSDLQINMMKDMFEMAFAPSKAEAEQASLFEKQREEALAQKPPLQQTLSKDAFIPLPDFMFTFKSHKEKETQQDLENPQAKAEFDLDISLQSQQTSTQNGVINKQNQEFNMKGFYRRFNEDRTRMITSDYTYQANKEIRTVLEESRLISATISEHNIADVHMKYYKLNPKDKTFDDGVPKYILSGQDHTIREYKDFDEISDTLLNAHRVSHKPLELLKELFIKPFEEGVVIYSDSKGKISLADKVKSKQ